MNLNKFLAVYALFFLVAGAGSLAAPRSLLGVSYGRVETTLLPQGAIR